MSDIGSRPAVPSRLNATEKDAHAHARSAAKPPWYRQVPVLIPLVVSVTALLLALTTTYIGEKRVERQQEHDARVELRSLIQRLTVLPRENIELMTKYENNPDALITLNSASGTENAVLSKEAADLIESDLGGDVSATEYYATAIALEYSGYLIDSDRFFREGLARANDRTSELALRRDYGAFLMTAGNVEGGRKQFEEALTVFQKYPDPHQSYASYTNANSQVLWASSELATGNCEQAARHAVAARVIVQSLDERWRSAIQSYTAPIEKKCPYSPWWKLSG